MAIKEKDLPVAGSLSASDYLRIVTSEGASKLAQADVVPAIEKGTTSISATVGTLVSHEIARYGKVRTLRMTVSKDEATPAGQNVFTGTLSRESDRPAVLVNGIGYYASSAGILQINKDGSIVVRVIGAQLAANGNIYISVTYLVN